MEEFRIFKRKIYSKLQEWKREENGKTALLVKGARRVGKSTIVKEFARNEYKSLHQLQKVDTKNIIGD